MFRFFSRKNPLSLSIAAPPAYDGMEEARAIASGPFPIVDHEVKPMLKVAKFGGSSLADAARFLHAREIVRGIIEGANELSGEKFGPHWPLTELSGGQSRALMIADTACLSASPVVLIDEIENAGIDRNKAFRLLTKKNKIVLLSTHDPLLALLCQRRILIAGGAIRQIAVSSPEEKDVLSRLEEMDQYQRIVREAIRSGKPIPAHFLFTEEERYVSL